MIESAGYKRENYIYASAYIRCVEKYLLTQEKAEKMLNSATPDDALGVLNELNYGDGLGSARITEFENLLTLELEKVYDMILSLIPQKECFAVFLYPNDYHNIKVLLKAEFLRINADGFLINAGSVPLDRLAEFVRKRNYQEMRAPMANGIREAIEAYGTGRDPQAIDLTLDKACYLDIGAETARVKNKFIKGYIALKIDTINLTSFMRVKQMKKPKDFFRKVFISGGNIPDTIFYDGYAMEPGLFAGKLGAYGLETALREGAAVIKESGRFTVLEKLCDDLLMKYIIEAKYICYGIEPLFAYAAAKENEIKTARIIIAGKLARLPYEQIKERVRKAYA